MSKVNNSTYESYPHLDRLRQLIVGMITFKKKVLRVYTRESVNINRGCTKVYTEINIDHPEGIEKVYRDAICIACLAINTKYREECMYDTVIYDMLNAKKDRCK